MSSGFSGSVVLQNNITGVSAHDGVIFAQAHSQHVMQHTSLAAMSECVASNVRTYFVNGTLSEAGAVCQSEKSIFESANATGSGGGFVQRRDSHIPRKFEALKSSKKGAFTRTKKRRFL